MISSTLTELLFKDDSVGNKFLSPIVGITTEIVKI